MVVSAWHARAVPSLTSAVQMPPMDSRPLIVAIHKMKGRRFKMVSVSTLPTCLEQYVVPFVCKTKLVMRWKPVVTTLMTIAMVRWMRAVYLVIRVSLVNLKSTVTACHNVPEYVSASVLFCFEL